MVTIHIYNRQKDLNIDKRSARALVDSLLEFLKVQCDELSIYFITEEMICRLHEKFFEDPTPTDCISFPLDENHLGEIFVCPKVALEYAGKKNLDPYQETSLYVAHGLLHLLGYDDLESEQRRCMRKKEKSCMHHLNRHKCFLGPK